MTYDDHIDCDRQLNEAEEQILKLKAKNKSLRSKVKLWKNRVDEAVIIVANYEDYDLAGTSVVVTGSLSAPVLKVA